MKYLLPLVLLLLATFARADVAWQSTATPDTAFVTTSLSTTINPSGSDLVVIIAVYGSGQAAPPTVTYGAQTPVLIDDGGTDLFEPSMWLYYVFPTAPGTQTISVTFGVNCPRCALGAIAFTGVHQTTPVGTAVAVADSGTDTHTATVTDAVATGMVVDWALVSGTSILADGSQTLRWEAENWEDSFNSVGQSTKTGTGSVSMTWTTPGNEDGGIIAVAILPAEGGGGNVVPSIYQTLRQQKR